MPLYEYQCCFCDHKFEKFYKLKDCKTVPWCPECGHHGEKVFTAQIQRDEPTWLTDDVRDALMDREDPHRRLETRTDYNRYLKDNGIMPIG